jgi:hypothetical protein
MNKAMRTIAFIASIYFVGGTLAGIFLNWPMDMPRWLYHMTMFAIRITGLGEVDNNDDAEEMATVIVTCISWALTGVMLWLLADVTRRWWSKRKA